MLQRVHREIRNMKKLKHSNIAELYESESSNIVSKYSCAALLWTYVYIKELLTLNDLFMHSIGFETDTHHCIAMEYIPGGELFDYVLDRHGLCEEQAREFFTQIVQATQHCHKVSFNSVNRSGTFWPSPYYQNLPIVFLVWFCKPYGWKWRQVSQKLITPFDFSPCRTQLFIETSS